MEKSNYGSSNENGQGEQAMETQAKPITRASPARICEDGGVQIPQELLEVAQWKSGDEVFSILRKTDIWSSWLASNSPKKLSSVAGSTQSAKSKELIRELEEGRWMSQKGCDSGFFLPLGFGHPTAQRVWQEFAKLR